MKLQVFSLFLFVTCVGVSLVTAQEAKERFSLKGHRDGVTGVAFSPDGKQIVSGSVGEKSVILWDATTGKEILSLKAETNAVRSVAFSPDGKRIVATDSVRVAVWDASTGKEILALDRTGARGIGGIYSVAFSPDGQRIACAGLSVDEKRRDCGEVTVWDAATGKEVLSFKDPEDNLRSVAFSPDGKQIVAGAYLKVKVWDAATGKELLSLKGHTEPDKAAAWWPGIFSVAFSPDGKRIVAGLGRDPRNPKSGELKVWDAATGKELLSIKPPYAVTSVAFSPDGKRIVSGGDAEEEAKPAELKVWDAVTGKELHSLKGHTTGIPSVAFSPDGKRIVSGSWDKSVKVWDIPTDK